MAKVPSSSSKDESVYGVRDCSDNRKAFQQIPDRAIDCSGIVKIAMARHADPKLVGYCQIVFRHIWFPIWWF